MEMDDVASQIRTAYLIGFVSGQLESSRALMSAKLFLEKIDKKITEWDNDELVFCDEFDKAADDLAKVLEGINLHLKKDK